MAYKFIQTYSGKIFEFENPEPSMISIVDIAHALSNICRYGGHSKHFYSVAEHSMNVADLVPDEHKLSALLHDATEAYVGDVVGPLKHMLGDTYAEYERKARWAICEKFRIPTEIPVEVMMADRHMLYIESQRILNTPPSHPHYKEWHLAFKVDGLPDDCDTFSFGRESHRIEKFFLDEFQHQFNKKHLY